jgi:hypothetical protein
MNEEKSKEINDFSNKILEAPNNSIIEGTLKTSERVLKRVTDGIYRQTSSALRELISNAYDADATKVEIQTDAPRFKQIIVRDNGNGITPKALSYLINNIGGSSKRTPSGTKIGVCNSNDKLRSPGGRKLIGKIGIGLFSVSQLTKEFQIITKTENSNYRTIADVVLHTYSEDSTDDPDQEFVTGKVKIWKVPATDKNTHGTEVVLRNLLLRTKDELTSKEMWGKCASKNDGVIDEVFSIAFVPPVYHIGCVYKDLPDIIEKKASLPWESIDTPIDKFNKLVNAMHELQGEVAREPSIYDHFDYYLRMLWVLSLSAPLDYFEGHPFDLRKEEGLKIFLLGNNRKDQAEDLILSEGQSIRQKMHLVSPERGNTSQFNVIIDGVQLMRPIRFRNLPKTLETVPFSLLFLGKDSPDLSIYPEEVRGGDLQFEGYLLWTHKVVPKEHAGILIRINDSNGVLFDDTFMHYPVSEQRRKTQVTAEIFVTKGLDAALNIDRESFNYSHPHYQYITHWVHNAFRQFANKHKEIGKEIREKDQTKKSKQALDELESNLKKSLRTLIPNDEPLPEVEFIDDIKEQINLRKKGVLAFKRSEIFMGKQASRRKSQQQKHDDAKFEAQIKALTKVLDAYGVLNNLSYAKQQNLLRDIVAIFS